MKSTTEIIGYARNTIDTETENLKRLTGYVNQEFADIVNLILNSRGRVVITGIGKSAIIAQKIVATLNSTGTPSIFMHAADAIHGDLGIIQKDDIIIAISKSGNTPEIVALAPLLKQFGNPLVGMTGNLDSALAKAANYIINTTVEKEACPNNLAPTTSTTAQLVMGDALAVALLSCRNFTSEDFSKYHPGGALGKRLYLTVKDIAAQNEKPMVAPDDDIKTVLVTISVSRLGATAVIDNNVLCGIITDGDIRRMVEKSLNFTGMKARDIMGTSPRSVEEDTLAVAAAEICRNAKISQLIVTSGGKYSGMIHIHDLNREGVMQQ